MDGRISFINKKNRKALVTTVMILGTFLLFWLPISCKMLIEMFVTIPLTYDVVKLSEIFKCLLLLNTICDPIIYAIRIHHVRKGFLILLSKVASKCLKHKFTDPHSGLHYRKHGFNQRWKC